MEQVILRPVESQELGRLLQLQWDPSAPGEFQWFGFRMDTVRELERRWHEDGLIGGAASYLAVGVEDGGCGGWVTWRPLGATPNYEIDNLAEQHALERAGFQKEGIARGLYFRAGAWRDSVIYAVLRTDVQR